MDYLSQNNDWLTSSSTEESSFPIYLLQSALNHAEVGGSHQIPNNPVLIGKLSNAFYRSLNRYVGNEADETLAIPVPYSSGDCLYLKKRSEELLSRLEHEEPRLHELRKRSYKPFLQELKRKEKMNVDEMRKELNFLLKSKEEILQMLLSCDQVEQMTQELEVPGDWTESVLFGKKYIYKMAQKIETDIEEVELKIDQLESTSFDRSVFYF